MTTSPTPTPPPSAAPEPPVWGPYNSYPTAQSGQAGPHHPCPAFVLRKLNLFLNAYGKTGDVPIALATASVTRRQYNRWKLAYPDFADDVRWLYERRCEAYADYLRTLSKNGNYLATRYLMCITHPGTYSSRHYRPDGPPRKRLQSSDISTPDQPEEVKS